MLQAPKERLCETLDLQSAKQQVSFAENPEAFHKALTLFGNSKQDLWLDLKPWSAGATELENCLLQASLRFHHIENVGIILIAPLQSNGSGKPSPQPHIFLTQGLWSHPALQAKPGPQEVSAPKLADLLADFKSSLPGFHLPSLSELSQAVLKVTRVISTLRAPNGCPWDQEQTFATLKAHLIEEAYEATEASDLICHGKDPQGKAFRDELGDVLLQILLNSQIAAESGLFNLVDVCNSLSEKMIRRHPHVFHPDHEKIGSAAGVKDSWEKIKQQERAEQGSKAAASSNATETTLLKKALKKKALPTLDYVAAVSKQATRMGFCWPEFNEVWRDVENEVKELAEEIHIPSPNWEKVKDELGDVIFALANVVVHSRLNLGAPDSLTFDAAARASTAKFVTRFQEMERIFIEEKGEPLTEETARSLPLEHWEELWSLAKARRYR